MKKSRETGKRFTHFRTPENYFRQDIRRREYAGAFLQTGFLMGTIGYLFYESFWAAVVCVPIGVLYFREWEKECVEKKKQEFQKQFQEAIQSLSASLHVGYSLENAMKEVKKDLDVLYSAETAIQREFTYMIRQIYIQIPMEQIFAEWADRVDQEDVRNFVQVFIMAKKSGGDMVGIICDSIGQIREKLEVQREIGTLLAAKKYEFRVMAVVPFGIIAYMKLSFPEFMNILYGNVIGIGVMSLCLAIYIGAYYLGVRIVNIEV
ncbi:type II secretion system F family protein [Sporofaciens sp. SGI.106]|uniref:type II secretion system F family protein n=1 Tax=Sporofaciens sp. SGI.106 TaxID=3420568 RepID=UPI002A93DC7B|nr:type II secretion system F family protein [Lachnoclostridium sp.]